MVTEAHRRLRRHARPPLGADGQCPPGYFLQRAVAGRVHSVVFAANGREAAVVGYNAIWQEPGRFTYCGAIADRSLPARVRKDLAEVVPELTTAFGLRGLCGADFIVDEDERWTLIEINPRPTASFELHERDGGLFTVHVDACRGRLPARAGPQENKIGAVRVLYAPHALRIPQATAPLEPRLAGNGYAGARGRANRHDARRGV